MTYKCKKALNNVQFTDYVLCGDECCDLPVDSFYDFELDEEYEFEDNACDAGRCGKVYLSNEELVEYFEKIK
mgnify:CR=1 FL=1